MSPNAKRVLWRFFLFAMFGLLTEVMTGVAWDIYHADWRHLRGSTSIWMIPDYGLLGLLTMPIALPLIRRGVPLPVRAAVYMVLIFAVEYSSGMLFHKVMHLSVWDYSGYKYHLHGQITPYYIPLWYGLGLAVEPLYRRIDAMAATLACGLSAKALMDSKAVPRP